jgi:hypothetical protein
MTVGTVRNETEYSKSCRHPKHKHAIGRQLRLRSIFFSTLLGPMTNLPLVLLVKLGQTNDDARVLTSKRIRDQTKLSLWSRTDGGRRKREQLADCMSATGAPLLSSIPQLTMASNKPVIMQHDKLN